MSFSGLQRSGDLAAGSVNYDVSRFRFQGDFGYGRFSGLRSDNTHFSGYGAAVDVAGTFQVTSELAVQAVTHISERIFSARNRDCVSP